MKTEHLKKPQKLYRAIFDNAAIGIDLVDCQGRFTKVNRALAQMLGYTQSELEQLSPLHITHPDDAEASRDRLKALENGEIDSYGMEKKYIRKNGEVCWASIWVSAIHNADGKYEATLGVIADITDRKRSEDKVRQQNSFLKSVLEALRHPFYVINVDDYSLEMANKAALRGKALTESTCYSAVLGRTSPCTGKDHRCPLQEVVGTRRPVCLEHEYRDHRGERQVLAVHAHPIMGDGGTVAPGNRILSGHYGSSFRRKRVLRKSLSFQQKTPR